MKCRNAYVFYRNGQQSRSNDIVEFFCLWKPTAILKIFLVIFNQAFKSASLLWWSCRFGLLEKLLQDRTGRGAHHLARIDHSMSVAIHNRQKDDSHSLVLPIFCS